MAEHHVTCSCDPMRCNTFSNSQGIKTRDFDAVLSELQSFFDIHSTEDSVAGGVHLEITGENVTECVGGIHNVQHERWSKIIKVAVTLISMPRRHLKSPLNFPASWTPGTFDF